jgi:hypothetical protein
MARQHQHAVLPGIGAVAPRIFRTAGLAVAIEIQPARHAGVHRCEEAVRILDRLLSVLPDGEKLALEHVGGRSVRHVVELVEQQHVGPQVLDHRRHLAHVFVVAFEASHQAARVVAVERHVEGGEAHRGRRARRLHPAGREQRHQQRHEDQFHCHPCAVKVCSGRKRDL